MSERADPGLGLILFFANFPLILLDLQVCSKELDEGSDTQHEDQLAGGMLPA